MLHLYLSSTMAAVWDSVKSPRRHFSKKHLRHILKCCEWKWKPWRKKESEFWRPFNEFRHEPILGSLDNCKENIYLWSSEYTILYALAKEWISFSSSVKMLAYRVMAQRILWSKIKVGKTWNWISSRLKAGVMGCYWNISMWILM